LTPLFGAGWMRGMEEKPEKPALTPKALAAKQEREARAAAALRENLRKRKQQSRERKDESPTPGKS
jgi:hypothetical protein